MTNTKWGNNKDANGHQLLNLYLQLIAGNHGSPSEGLIHMNTTAHRPQVHNGTALKQLAYTDDIVSGGDAETLEGEDGAYYLDRDNHEGTQLAATISDFASAVAAAIPGSYATDAEVSAAIANLVDSAPGALDTLNELAAALGDDANFASTITTALAARVQDRRFTIGDGSATSFNLDHNLNTKRAICQAYVISSGAQIEPDFDRTTVNRVVCTFGTAPATNTVEVVVMGRSD